MLGGGPLERNVCYLYTHYCKSSKSLKGDRGRDRSVTMRRMATPEIVLSRKKSFSPLNSASKVANWIKIDILKYLYYPCVQVSRVM